MAGLVHPESIDLWREWSGGRTVLTGRREALADAARALRGRRPKGTLWEEPRWMLHSRDGETSARLLIALDDAAPRTRDALLAFLPYLRVGVDVIAPRGAAVPELGGDTWRRRAFESARDAVPSDASAVVTIGQQGPAGSAAHSVAHRRGLPAFVVQSDALTPYAAPLPEGAILLAWSEADADFWRSGREDLELLPVGSQRLWQFAHDASVAAEDRPAGGRPDEERPAGDGPDGDRAGEDHVAEATSGEAGTPPAHETDAAEESGASAVDAPVVLGQLARRELPRSLASRSAAHLCRGGGARYLPGPGETGGSARALHGLWSRRGVEILPVGTDPLTLSGPLVSILATEVLEVAARGGEAWVHAPGAPGWVHEYWHRYGMRRHGTPTPAPRVPDEEPAARIAREVEETL